MRRDPTAALMHAEASEAGDAVARLYDSQAHAFERLGARLREARPRLVVTCARGSSDHAATYAKYLIETRAYAICASCAPSVSSIYLAPAPAQGALALTISQSGKSPDILHAAQNLKESGALLIAFVNDADSPLARLADETIPLCAGPEHSVAATKSYIASLAAIAMLVARWIEDSEMLAALARLPEALGRAWALDWTPLAEALETATNALVLGRGLSLGAAQEAALKLKETCQLHAEAYSAAEALHGPAALVRDGFPILAFAQDDETLPAYAATLDKLARFGARVFVAGLTPPQGGRALPEIAAPPALQPILQIASFYKAANLLAARRGLDPDRPPNLAKITETI